MLASGESTLATACCRWSKLHNPACTQTTSATTAATVRIEHLPRGAEGRDPNLSPRFNQGRSQRTSAEGVLASSHQSWPFQGKQRCKQKNVARNFKQSF